MLNSSREFHFDDVTETSVLNIIDGDIADESITQGTAFLWPKGVTMT